jgi:hypothetical protein
VFMIFIVCKSQRFLFLWMNAVELKSLKNFCYKEKNIVEDWRWNYLVDFNWIYNTFNDLWYLLS